METRWQEIEKLFGEILELPADEGRKVLEGRNLPPEVRRRVAELLRAWRESEGFLEQPALGVPLASSPEPDRFLGQRLGPWRVTSVIGTGGMGAVYRAERDDGEFAQQAALKVIAAGRLSPFSNRRFREERSILARLEHPYVARLIDGGVAPDGSPFLVMEYVEGTPIDAWCREQNCDRRARLRLFLQVCEAVQFAHQKLVVHCDLKAANILVTRHATPKLLDFGIARLLAQESDPSATTLHALTPDYASPEQMRGEAPGTASDVYSLGVLLHELLTGRRPYRLTGMPLAEALATISEKKIDEPGTGAADLDAIILKALCKEPQRRYGSVVQFADDLQRYLEGRPVSACPDTFLYRMRKFAVRRAIPLAAAGVVLATAAAGTLGIVVQSRRAERRFNDVRSLAHAVLYDVYDSISGLPGTLPARRLVASRAQQYLDALARDTGGDSTLIRDLAESYLRLGEVRGSPYVANLGDTAGALESFRKGQALIENDIARYPNDLANRELLYRIRMRLCRVFERQGKPEMAISVLRQAVGEAEARHRRDPQDLTSAEDLSLAYAYLSEVQDMSAKQTGDVSAYEQALETSRRALAVLESMGKRSEESWEEARAARYQRIGYASGLLGDRTADRSYYQQALDCFLKVDEFNRRRAAAHRDRNYERGIADDLNSIGLMRWKCCADRDGARRDLGEALAAFQRLAQQDPHNLEAIRDLATIWKGIGVVLAEAGVRREAVESNRKALALFEELDRADPHTAENAEALAQVRSRLAALEHRP